MAVEGTNTQGGEGQNPAQDPAPQTTQDPTPGVVEPDAQSLRTELDETNRKLQAANAQAKAERHKRAALQGQLESFQTPAAPPDESFISVTDAQRIAQEEVARSQQVADNAKLDEGFNKRLAVANEKHKDIDVTGLVNDDTLPISPAMAGVLKQDELGAELLVWLHQNRDKAAELSTLTPERAAVELGRISSKMSDPGSTNSGAPDPINPLGGSGVSSKDEESMSTKELEAKLREQRGGSAFPRDAL